MAAVRLPAASTAAAVSWWLPSARFSTGRQDQLRSAATAVLHSSPPTRTDPGVVAASVTETVLPGSAVPVSSRPGSLVYAGRVSTGAAGGSLLTVSRTASPRSTTPPLVVSTGTRLWAPWPSALSGRQDQLPSVPTLARQSVPVPSTISTVAPATAPSPRISGRLSGTTAPLTGPLISGRAAPTVSWTRWSSTSPESAKPDGLTSCEESRASRSRAQVSPAAAPSGTVHSRVADELPGRTSVCTRSVASKRPLWSKSIQPARTAGPLPGLTGTVTE